MTRIILIGTILLLSSAAADAGCGCRGNWKDHWIRCSPMFYEWHHAVWFRFHPIYFHSAWMR